MRTETLPTGSVTGRDGWDWENPVTNDESRQSQVGGDTTDRPAATRPHARIATLEEEVASLETALERKDEQLQSVIDRYEILLRQRQQRSTTSADRTTTQHSRFRRLADRIRGYLFDR